MHSEPPESRHFVARVLRRSLTAALACAVVLAAVRSTPSQAASDYPTKPVRVFVPYGPGGVGDLTMRLLADQLSRELKQQFIIENRPGAGGIVAMTEVLKAPADGYTLGEMGNGQAISMSLFNSLPYDVLKDSPRYQSQQASRCCSRFLTTRHTRPLRISSPRSEKPWQAQCRRHQSRQHTKPLSVSV